MGRERFGRPSGTRVGLIPLPGVETPGYCQSSLRDAGGTAEAVPFPSCGAAAARYTWAAWTAEGGCPHMSCGGGWGSRFLTGLSARFGMTNIFLQ
jgi:hypothetical protein